MHHPPSETTAGPVAAEETTTDAGAAITEAGGKTRAEISPAGQPANDNTPVVELPATGTDGKHIGPTARSARFPASEIRECAGRPARSRGCKSLTVKE